MLDAILPGDPAFRDSRVLAEAARQRILCVLDEPDLAVTRHASDAAATMPLS
jgi:hypothetical protein